METKKDVIKYLNEKIRDLIPLKIQKIKSKGDITFYELENNCSIEFYFESLLGGRRGKNSFCLKVSMSLYNPFLARLISVGRKQVYDDSLLSQLVSHIDWDKIPEEKYYDRYFFWDGEDKKNTADRLIGDIEKYYIQFILPNLSNYNLLIENFKDPTYVKCLGGYGDFIKAVIVAILTHQEDKIESYIVPFVKNNLSGRKFMEFRDAKDYQEEIINPLIEYIKSNNITLKQNSDSIKE